jgi:hypothetical protein
MKQKDNKLSQWTDVDKEENELTENGKWKNTCFLGLFRNFHFNIKYIFCMHDHGYNTTCKSNGSTSLHFIFRFQWRLDVLILSFDFEVVLFHVAFLSLSE